MSDLDSIFTSTEDRLYFRTLTTLLQCTNTIHVTKRLIGRRPATRAWIKKAGRLEARDNRTYRFVQGLSRTLVREPGEVVLVAPIKEDCVSLNVFHYFPGDQHFHSHQYRTSPTHHVSEPAGTCTTNTAPSQHLLTLGLSYVLLEQIMTDPEVGKAGTSSIPFSKHCANIRQFAKECMDVVGDNTRHALRNKSVAYVLLCSRANVGNVLEQGAFEKGGRNILWALTRTAADVKEMIEKSGVEPKDWSNKGIDKVSMADVLNIRGICRHRNEHCGHDVEPFDLKQEDIGTYQACLKFQDVIADLISSLVESLILTDDAITKLEESVTKGHRSCPELPDEVTGLADQVNTLALTAGIHWSALGQFMVSHKEWIQQHLQWLQHMLNLKHATDKPAHVMAELDLKETSASDFDIEFADLEIDDEFTEFGPWAVATANWLNKLIDQYRGMSIVTSNFGFARGGGVSAYNAVMRACQINCVAMPAPTDRDKQWQSVEQFLAAGLRTRNDDAPFNTDELATIKNWLLQNSPGRFSSPESLQDTCGFRGSRHPEALLSALYIYAHVCRGLGLDAKDVPPKVKKNLLPSKELLDLVKLHPDTSRWKWNNIFCLSQPCNPVSWALFESAKVRVDMPRRAVHPGSHTFWQACDVASFTPPDLTGKLIEQGSRELYRRFYVILHPEAESYPWDGVAFLQGWTEAGSGSDIDSNDYVDENGTLAPPVVPSVAF